MTIKQKIELAAQPNKLYLFKEGMFYKLYNQNAMWFVQNEKPYKVTKKFLKTVNQDVYSIGFPQAVLSLNKLQINLKPIKEETNYLCYQVTQTIREQEFASWCNTTLTNQVKLQSKATTQNIVQQLKHFDVANNTPMQALEFVVKLKAML